MRPSRLTIRARITGGSLVIAILISVIVGIVIYSRVQTIVTDGQLAILQSIEDPYITALQRGSEDLDAPGVGQLVAVVSPIGVQHVNTLPEELGEELHRLVADPASSRIVAVGTRSYLMRVSVVPTDSGTWTVVTASPSDLEAVVLNEIAVILIGSIALINLAFGAASWLIGTAALRPVGRLRRSAAELVAAPGAELLPVGPARDEIAELAQTLNELIGQLRASADRERQIVSDASHEFRTPLAIMRTQLELAQRQATSLDEMQADVTAAQATLARLSTLATSMLELSRIEAQDAPGRSTAPELASELADAVDRARVRAADRDIRIDYATDVQAPEVTLAVAVADFGRVCDNLMSNSLAALGATGTIEASLIVSPDGAWLRMTDDAGGMPEEFVASAFDRFSRADQARGRGGAGLGLPIVAGIAALAGGRVRLDNRPGVGLTVEVSFPARGEGAPALSSGG